MIDSTGTAIHWVSVAGKVVGQWAIHVRSPCSSEIYDLGLVMKSGLVITYLCHLVSTMLKGYWFVSHCASSVHQSSHQDQRKHRQCEDYQPVLGQKAVAGLRDCRLVFKISK